MAGFLWAPKPGPWKKPYPIIVFVFIVFGCELQESYNLKVITLIELNRVKQEVDIFLVEVHTPEQLHIKATKLLMPYTEIEKYLGSVDVLPIR